jgi:hypothetical protein
MTDVMNRVLLNQDLIAIHQDDAVLQGTRVGFDTTSAGCAPGLCQLWARPLAGGDVFAVL